MQDVLIAKWTSKKFTIFIALSIFAQIVCFMIAQLVAPLPTTRQNILATACKENPINDSNATESETWYYTRGKGGCEIADMFMHDKNIQDQVFQVIYTVPIASEKNDIFQDYSKRQQNLIGFLHMDIVFQPHLEIRRKSPIVMDIKLAYKNKDDPNEAWKLYTVSRVERTLECFVCSEEKHTTHDCEPIPLFELNSIYHDYYLLNIRFPLIDEEKNTNELLVYMSDMWLTAINQNRGFTKVWANLQTVFFPIIIITLAWYWRRLHTLPTPPVLLQYMVLTLGCTMSFLNIPLEYIMVYFNMPEMLVLNDFKEVIFYGVILSFWLIFVGEHLMIQDADVRNTLKSYWRHFGAVAIGCLSSIIYVWYDRIVHFKNPFIRASVNDEHTSHFIRLIEVLASLYLSLLTYMVYKVFANINKKKPVLPGVSPVRQLHYINVIYRFKFLMIITLLCASLTIIGFIVDQIAESEMKCDEDYEFETSSVFFIGIYGMWNIYTVALLCLYAPSFKKMTN